MKDLVVVAGTRPELVKVAPVIRALQRLKAQFKFLYTGQHYDYELSRSFIQDLELPEPDNNLHVQSGGSAAMTGQIVVQAAEAIRSFDPSLVVVQGDTNTALAATIAAVKEGVPVAHIESGLRSNDWRMPEEHNRRMIDHVSSHLYAPTELTLSNLIGERTAGTKHVTGNTVIDATIQNLPKAERISTIRDQLDFDQFILATAHRAENVDKAAVLKGFVDIFLESPLPVVFPAHPRTIQRLKRLNLLRKLTGSGKVQLLPPIGYFDFLSLMKRCSLILTDSGGIQEEATSPVIRKKVVVMRSSTERPEAVESGFAKIAGTRKDDILDCIENSLDNETILPTSSPFGNGKSGEMIANLLIDAAEVSSIITELSDDGDDGNLQIESPIRDPIQVSQFAHR